MKQTEHVIAAGTLNIVYSNVRLVKQFGYYFFSCFYIVLSTRWKNLERWSFPAESEGSKAAGMGDSGSQEMVAFWSVLEKTLQFVWKSRSDQRASMTFVKESISICFKNSSFKAQFISLAALLLVWFWFVWLGFF